MNATDRDALRRYLLGASDALAREELERRLFSDDEIFWERLSIAEDELIDDYATGALDADDRALFDSHFLSTGERRARLEFARAIHAYARRREPGRLGAWRWLRSSSAVPRWAMAAAALLVLTLLPAAVWRMAPGDVTPAVVVRLAITRPASRRGHEWGRACQPAAGVRRLSSRSAYGRRRVRELLGHPP